MVEKVYPMTLEGKEKLEKLDYIPQKITFCGILSKKGDVTHGRESLSNDSRR